MATTDKVYNICKLPQSTYKFPPPSSEYARVDYKKAYYREIFSPQGLELTCAIYYPKSKPSIDPNILRNPQILKSSNILNKANQLI